MDTRRCLRSGFLSLGLRVKVLGIRVLAFGFRLSGLGFWAWRGVNVETMMAVCWGFVNVYYSGSTQISGWVTAWGCC